MGEALLAVLPSVLLRLIIPVGAAVVVGILARDRARTFGVAGFVAMALGLLIGGTMGGMLPFIMRTADLPVNVVVILMNVVNVVFSAATAVLLVLAIVSRSRINPGPGMPMR